MRLGPADMFFFGWATVYTVVCVVGAVLVPLYWKRMQWRFRVVVLCAIFVALLPLPFALSVDNAYWCNYVFHCWH